MMIGCFSFFFLAAVNLSLSALVVQQMALMEEEDEDTGGRRRGEHMSRMHNVVHFILNIDRG
jgi:hypothetical protein